jgi:phage tail P2-like protein
MSDLHLLPANATDGERAISLAIERHATLPVPVRDVWNPATCPANLLAWLAWAYSVDEWDSAWSDTQKRQIIQTSLDVHRHKGTIGAVKEALTSLGIEVLVQEWFNQIPEGNPYTFKVLLQADQTGISQEAIKSLFAVIERTKNLRSHLDKVEVIAKTTTGPRLAAVTGLGSDIRVTKYVWATAVFNETTICF